MPTREITITTSALNSDGFRVLTEGADLEQYKKNPILIWMHIRPTKYSGNERMLPIGKLENIRTDGDSILATPVFDEDDEFAMQIKRKYDKGIINMCSIGADPIETSSDPKYIVPGQRYDTVIKWKLIEVSMVDIGSNDNAIAVMYKNGKRIELSGNGVNVPLPELNNNLNKQKNMTNIAKMLGLAETATEAEVMTAIQSLSNSNNSIKLELQKFKDDAKKAEDDRIETLVAAAIKEQKINAKQKDFYVSLAQKSGASALEEVFSNIAPVNKASSYVSNFKTDKSDERKFLKYSASELEELKQSDKEAYLLLYEAEFGFKPNNNH